MNNEEQRAVCPQKGYWVSPQKEKKVYPNNCSLNQIQKHVNLTNSVQWQM